MTMSLGGRLATLGEAINAHALWAHGPITGYVALMLINTHVTTACVTLYLHRRVRDSPEGGTSHWPACEC